MGNGHNIYMDDKRICIFIKHNGTVFKEREPSGTIRYRVISFDNKEGMAEQKAYRQERMDWRDLIVK